MLNWLTYTSPFSIGIWILTFGGMLACYVLFVLTAKVGQYFEEDLQFGNYSLSLMIVVFGMVNQGSPNEPQKISSRIVFLVIFFTVTLLWSAYSAVLTSALTAKNDKPPFNTLQGFMHDTDYQMVTIAGGFYESLFKAISWDFHIFLTSHYCFLVFQKGNQIQQNIYKTRMALVKSFDDAFKELTTTPGVVIFGSSSRFDQMIAASCDYKKIPGYRIDTLYSFYVRQNSPYEELFNYQ